MIEFYLDYRDCDFTDYYNGKNDIWIKFNATDLSVKIDWDDDDFIDNVTLITPGSLYKIWLEKYKTLQNNKQNTNYLENFWSNCLVLIASPNNHPRFVWGPNPDLRNITGYKIYRAVHPVPNPRPKVYSLIATVNEETFDYIDNDIILDENGDYIWYYIKAYNSQTESPISNVVTSNGGLYKQKAKGETQETVYSISQNYLNPFNPTTIISYEIPKATQVKITVFGVLGKEVAALVNEQKPAGEYEVEFNAEGLRSGMYFYSITAGEFHQTKKMILLR